MQAGTTLCTWEPAASAGLLEEEKKLLLDQLAAAQAAPGASELGFAAVFAAAAAEVGAWQDSILHCQDPLLDQGTVRDMNRALPAAEVSSC